MERSSELGRLLDGEMGSTAAEDVERAVGEKQGKVPGEDVSGTA